MDDSKPYVTVTGAQLDLLPSTIAQNQAALEAVHEEDIQVAPLGRE